MQTNQSSKTALVTGASRGIGKATVKRLCDMGYKVFATGRDANSLAQLQDETQCTVAVYDLQEADAVVALFKQAEQVLGHVDVVINNAGFNSRKSPLVETTLQEFDAQYAVNLRAPYLLCREALKHMLPRKQGYIINVISTVAKRINETMGIYTAMKSGLDGLNGVLMKEAQPNGIKVTAVYPGGVNTAFRAQARPQYMQAESVAYMITQLLTNPADVVVHELTFRPMVELE
ncbi:putative oxidoreductase [Thalassocella blandensis]|nr:putative oxidoreductase [Thalassocella blandensis]